MMSDIKRRMFGLALICTFSFVVLKAMTQLFLWIAKLSIKATIEISKLTYKASRWLFESITHYIKKKQVGQ